MSQAGSQQCRFDRSAPFVGTANATMTVTAGQAGQFNITLDGVPSSFQVAFGNTSALNVSLKKDNSGARYELVPSLDVWWKEAHPAALIDYAVR